MSETLKFSVVVRKWLYRVNRLKFFLSGRSLFSAEQYWAMILCGDTAAFIKKTEFSLKCHTLSRVLAPTTNRNMSRLALVSDSVLLIWTRTGFTDMKSSNRCCSWSPCWPPATLKRRPKTPKRSKTLKVVNWKDAATSAATGSATAATATASGVPSTAVMEDMVDMACTDTVVKWLTEATPNHSTPHRPHSTDRNQSRISFDHRYGLWSSFGITCSSQYTFWWNLKQFVSFKSCLVAVFLYFKAYCMLRGTLLIFKNIKHCCFIYFSET